jgi:hypothetical protein
MSVVRTLPRLEDEISASVVKGIGNAQPVATPFPYWRIVELLPQEVARAIAGLPFSPPDLSGVSGRRELHNAERQYLAGKVLREHPAARGVARAFQAWPVVAALMALTGAALVGSFLRIEFAADAEGFWLEPHTDLGVKLLTLFLQLAAPGQETLGTDLYWDAEHWATREPFGWNAALIFRPSERSWHGFAPRPIEGVRRSLIVNYVTGEWRSCEQLAFADRPVAPPGATCAKR